jgi:hypothetical protein
MLILEDTRQQENKHKNKHEYFLKNKIYWNRTALYIGDYTLPNDQSICVDTKKGLEEVINDIHFKSISKKDLQIKIDEIFVKHHITSISQNEILHMIWDNDSERFPEREITDICFANGISERIIADLQQLYIKRRGFFHRGLIRAKNSGIKLYILIENDDGLKSIKDVFHWQNPRSYRYYRIAYMHNKGQWLGTPLPKRKPTSGKTLAKAMLTIEAKYHAKFLFCKSQETGEMIIKILNKQIN